MRRYKHDKKAVVFKHDKKQQKLRDAMTTTKHTQYRQWKSGKTWVAASLTVVLVAGALSPVSLPFFGNVVQTTTAKAASTATVLNGGSSVTTPLATTSPAISSYSWGTPGDSSSVALPGATISGGWLTPNTAPTGHATVFPMNGTINMANSFNMTFWNKGDSGYSSGIYFIPASGTGAVANTAAALTPIASGSGNPGGLGIVTIPNAVFVGRDYFYDSGANDYYGNGFSAGTSGIGGSGNAQLGASRGTQIAIRTTNSTGVINKAGASTNVTGQANATTNGYANDPTNDGLATPTSGSNPGEQMQIQWQPNSGQLITSSTTTVQGTLTYTVGSKTVTYQNLVMQLQMNMGANFIAGNWTGENNNSFNMQTISANATAPIAVNYLSTATGTPAVLKQSTITASLNSTVGMTTAASGLTDSNLVDYQAPPVPGYKVATISGTNGTTTNSSATAGTVNGVAATGNVININYQAQPQQANFTFATTDTAGNKVQGTIPTISPVTGNTDAAITAPTVTPPTGYTVSGVKAPNGTVYSTLAAAIASDAGPIGTAGTFGATSNTSTPGTYQQGTNDFQIQLAPISQNVWWDYASTNIFGSSKFPYPTTKISGYPATVKTGSDVTNNVPTGIPTNLTGYAYSGTEYNGTWYGYQSSTVLEDGIAPGNNSQGSTTLNDAIKAALKATGGGTGTADPNQKATDPGNDVGGNNDNTYLLTQNPAASYSYGFVTGTGTGVNLPVNKTSIGGSVTNSGGTAGSIYSTEQQAFITADVPAGYFVQAIYRGTSATGTPLATGTAAADGSSATNAQLPTSESYNDATTPAANRNYFLQLAPISSTATFTYNWASKVPGVTPNGSTTKNDGTVIPGYGMTSQNQTYFQSQTSTGGTGTAITQPKNNPGLPQFAAQTATAKWYQTFGNALNGVTGLPNMNSALDATPYTTIVTANVSNKIAGATVTSGSYAFATGNDGYLYYTIADGSDSTWHPTTVQVTAAQPLLAAVRVATGATYSAIAANNSFTATVYANKTNVHWQLRDQAGNSLDAYPDNPQGYGYASGYAYAGSLLNQSGQDQAAADADWNLPTGGAPDGYFITGYTYTDDSGAKTTYAVNSTTTATQALAALYAANPTVSQSNPTITVNLQEDLTRVSTITPGDQTIARTQAYSPASGITGAADFDGALETTQTNNYNIGVVITSNATGNVVWTGDSSETLAPETLAKGSYTESYYALNSIGAAAYKTWLASNPGKTVGDFAQTLSQADQLADFATSSTYNGGPVSIQLDITDFALPYTGGNGWMTAVGLAGAAGVAAALAGKRRRKDDKEEKA